ncbi:hypothetical protein C8R45DRAFT_1026087 [Mycena sanguinolenta]|nr:hypothetical protein C8R45DRAFT_1026087 [Mycena sanguinolenta]
MVSFLERIPHDVLQHIALAGALPGYIPPVDLCCLLSTCRAIYNSLNIRSSPHLYAAIFKLKYAGSIASGQHTDSSLAAELIRRCAALRRCHRLDLSLPNLRQDLWTLLWMIVEEGRCIPLVEAHFSLFIVELARYYLGEFIPRRAEIESLVIWLLCLGLSRQDILSENPETRSTLVALLRPFVSTFESRAPLFISQYPPVVFHPVPQDHFAVPLAPSHTEVREPEDEVVMRYNVRICSPPLPSPSDAAIILIFVLKEAVSLQIPYHLPATRAIAIAENRSGPTAEDYTAFNGAVTPLYSDIRMALMGAHTSATTLKFIDPWISEILSVPGLPAERVRPAYLPGSLTGLWEGSMMISYVSSGDPPAKTDIPSDFLCRAPLQCEFPQDHCLTAGEPLSPGLDRDIVPCPDLNCSCENLPLDRVLIGQTLEDHDNAWASSGFKFAGGVHDDGQIILTRRPKNDETSEAWIFRGRLHHKTLVGTFRSSPDESCGVCGIFSMSKRAAAGVHAQ